MATDAPMFTDTPAPPGEILKDTLDGFGMTSKELAQRMGRPAQAISQIINGTKAITGETALQLECVLGTPAHVWVNLETNYQFNKARLEQQNKLEGQIADARNFPVNEMGKLGFIACERDPKDRVRALLRFFGVADLGIVHTRYDAAFRKSDKNEASPYALAAWLRQGEILAGKIETADYSPDAIRACLESIRLLTRRMGEGFDGTLRHTLAECGVAVVFVPHLPKTYAHGATFWREGKPVIQLSIRGRTDDLFWFTFFHEAGHILLHGRKAVFIEGLGTVDPAQEQEANNFARDMLIPERPYASFVRRDRFTTDAVRSFASEIQVSTGIVVGRLQHDGHLPQSHLNGLKRKLDWKE